METMAEMLPKAWDVWILNLEGSSELRFLGICVLELEKLLWDYNPSLLYTNTFKPNPWGLADKTRY
jgi:hypothetical protein